MTDSPTQVIDIPAEPPIFAPVSGSKKISVSKACVFFLLLYLGINTTEGFLRWALSLVHLEPLLYVRELSPILSLMFALAIPGTSSRTFLLFGLCLQLVFAGVMGFYYWGSVTQVAFGLKVFFPLLLGIAAYPSIMRDWQFFCRGCTVVLAIAIAGVLLNVYIHFPWIGADFTVGNVTVETSREWFEIDGRDRLPGFSRGSFTAASHIVFLSIFALYGARNLWKRLVISGVSVLAVYLTTAKSPLAALIQLLSNFFFLEGFSALRNPVPGSRLAKVKAVAIFALKLQIFIFTVATVFLPLDTTSALNLVEHDLHEDSQFHLMSIQERAARFWPLAMEHIQRYGSTWFGVGAGGLGSALDIFGNFEIPITCDNAFLYAYGVFGIFIVPYLLAFVWFTFSRRLIPAEGSTVMGLLTLAICSQALTSNTFEGVYECVFIGLIIAHTIYGARIADSPFAPASFADEEEASAEA